MACNDVRTHEAIDSTRSARPRRLRDEIGELLNVQRRLGWHTGERTTMRSCDVLSSPDRVDSVHRAT